MPEILFKYLGKTSLVPAWLHDEQLKKDIEIVQYNGHEGDHYIFYKEYPKNHDQIEVAPKKQAIPETRFNNIDVVTEKDDAFDSDFTQPQMRYLKKLLAMDIDVYPQGESTFTKEQRKELYEKVSCMIYEDSVENFEGVN